jgi:sodium-dependent phosphate cotransporter
MDNPSFNRDEPSTSSVLSQHPSISNYADVVVTDGNQSDQDQPQLDELKVSDHTRNDEDTKSNDLTIYKTIEKKNLDQAKTADLVDKDIVWAEYTHAEKVSYIVFSVIKFIIFFVLLYLFLLSLNFMTIGFTLVSNVALKGTDAIRFILSNPFAALSIGIIVTAIMQNATATTSIAVSMVGAGIIPSVKNAIPIIMGSNIGTCFTNSLIALTLANDPVEFKRAFSAATLNDIFNFLTTAVLLPIEIFTDMLLRISERITRAIPFENADQIAKANFIGAILNPLTDVFIVLNTTAVNALTNGDTSVAEIALRCCESQTFEENVTIAFNITENLDLVNVTEPRNMTRCVRECTHWCMPMLRSFGDAGTGLFWIIVSVVVLIGCLFGIVKVLSLLIVGPIAKGVRRGLNFSLSDKFKLLTHTILFMVSLILTVIVQSSNIITATLVPLCAIGLVSLQRVYVMTLGSNIGTTVTGILSAFTLVPSAMQKGLQLAFVYTFFNAFGVLFWLPLPFLRLPKFGARALGDLVFRYRWFLYFYMFSVYFILPIVVFCLALVPYWIGLAVFGLPVLFVAFCFVVIKLSRKFCPSILPDKLKSFEWLPLWMRSLEPYDRKISDMACCGYIRKEAIEKRPSFVVAELNKVTAVILPNITRQVNSIDGLIREGQRKMSVASVVSRSSSFVNLPAIKE